MSCVKLNNETRIKFQRCNKETKKEQKRNKRSNENRLLATKKTPCPILLTVESVNKSIPAMSAKLSLSHQNFCPSKRPLATTYPFSFPSFPFSSPKLSLIVYKKTSSSSHFLFLSRSAFIFNYFSTWSLNNIHSFLLHFLQIQKNHIPFGNGRTTIEASAAKTSGIPRPEQYPDSILSEAGYANTAPSTILPPQETTQQQGLLSIMLLLFLCPNPNPDRHRRRRLRHFLPLVLAENTRFPPPILSDPTFQRDCQTGRHLFRRTNDD